jgi:membrane protease YdiL (CAAX protease family)
VDPPYCGTSLGIAPIQPHDLVLVRRCDSREEAYVLAEILRGLGLAASVRAEEFNPLPSVTALPGASLWVPNEQQPKALKAINEHLRSTEAAGLAKTCPHCGEENPATFGACWRCQADLSTVPARPASPAAAPVRSEVIPERASGRRGMLLLEVTALLLVLFAPGIIADGQVQPIGQADAITQWLSWGLMEIGVVLLVGYLVWRDDRSLAPLGVTGVRWGREILWAIPLLVGLELTELLVTMGIQAAGIPVDEPGSGASAASTTVRMVAPAFFLVFALSEEVLFRGYLITRLREILGNPVAAVLVSAMLFGAVHRYGVGATVRVVVTGIVLGSAFLAGKKLPRLVLAHAAWNILWFYDTT